MSGTYLDNPYWRLLLAPQNSLCANDPRLCIYRPVNDVDSDYVTAVGVGIFVPHPNYNV